MRSAQQYPRPGPPRHHPAELLRRPGYHHERGFVALGPLEEFLLGLCFCPYGVEGTEAAGVDVGAAGTEVGRVVGRVIDGEEPRPGGVSSGGLSSM
jgi:hypothetical protein